MNTNKSALHLDVKDPKEKQKLLDLIMEADVFIQNNAFGALERLGLSREDLFKLVKNRNKGLIYVEGSSFGFYGPLATGFGELLYLFERQWFRSQIAIQDSNNSAKPSQVSAQNKANTPSSPLPSPPQTASQPSSPPQTATSTPVLSAPSEPLQRSGAASAREEVTLFGSR